MNLSRAVIGKPVLVDSISLPGNIKRRLQILGLTKGAKINVLRRKLNGAVIFSVRGTRYAAGKNIAMGIFVSQNGGDIH